MYETLLDIEMKLENSDNDFEFEIQITRLKAFISKMTENSENTDLISKSLILLAENTGCVEDYEVNQSFILELLYANKIDKEQIRLFYGNTNTGRWE